MLYIFKIPISKLCVFVVVGKTDRKKRMLDSWDEIIEDEDEVADE